MTCSLKIHVCVILFLCCLFLALSPSKAHYYIPVKNSMDKEERIIIDNDAGADDALAIFMALLLEKSYNGSKIIGLTTGIGNTNEDNVCTNNQRILKIAGRQDVPIYRGSKNSLVTTPPYECWYGLDGLGDVDDIDKFEGLVPANSKKAVQSLIEQSKLHEGNLSVITIGSLTNIALALQEDPDFIKRLRHLHIGAGHIHDDEYPRPQFNARMDVEAYHIVAQYAEPDRVTIFPYSVARKSVNFTKKWRESIFGTINNDEIRAMNKFERLSLNKTNSWDAIDPIVAAAFLEPNLVEEYKYSKTDIILSGDKRGLTTHTFFEQKDKANVKVVYKLKGKEYKQFLYNLFKTNED